MPSPIQKCDIWNAQKYDNLKITGSFILPYLLLASPGGFELCWNDNRPKKCNRVPCVSDIIHVYCAQEKREYFSKGALENNIWPFNKKSYNYKQWWGSWKWPSVGTLGKLIFISRKACVCHALAQFQGDPSLKCRGWRWGVNNTYLLLIFWTSCLFLYENWFQLFCENLQKL